MTATESDIYRGVARTFRIVARSDLMLAGIAHDRGDRREALARLRQARERVKEARRWDALAELGA